MKESPEVISIKKYPNFGLIAKIRFTEAPKIGALVKYKESCLKIVGVDVTSNIQYLDELGTMGIFNCKVIEYPYFPNLDSYGPKLK